MALNVRVLDSSTAALRQARVDLAAVHRIANRFGFDDGIWNHFTLMVPGNSDRFLVKAHGLLMNEITASSLIVADTEGTSSRVRAPSSVPPSASIRGSTATIRGRNASCTPIRPMPPGSPTSRRGA